MKNVFTLFLCCISAVISLPRVGAQPIACNSSIDVSLGSDGMAVLLNDRLVEGNYDVTRVRSYLLDSTNAVMPSYSVPGGLAFACSDVGKTFSYRVTDTINSLSCWGDITIYDMISPTPYVLADVVVALDSSTCSAEIFAIDFDAGTVISSFDNCGPIGFSFGAAGYYPAGTTIDGVTPDRDIDHYFDSNGTIVSSVAAASSNVHNAFEVGQLDKWNALRQSASRYVTLDDAGPIEVAVTDLSGNIDYAVSALTVVGCAGPAPSCLDTAVVALSSWTGSATVFAASLLSNAGATDALLSLDNNTFTTSLDFTCSDIGHHEVHLSFIHGGQWYICTSILKVIDIDAPVMVAESYFYLELADSSDQVLLLPSDINDGSFDICGTIGLNVSKAYFDISDLGVNTVLLYGTDNSGNTNAVMTTVFVSIGPCDSTDIAVTWPEPFLYINDPAADPSTLTSQVLINTYGFTDQQVNPQVSFSCNLIGTSIDVVDLPGVTIGGVTYFGILRTFTLADWVTGWTESYTQLITNVPNTDDYICDTEPRSAPVGDCSTGHTLNDDVEWPNDIVINDHRVTPDELILISGVDSADARPTLYNDPASYTYTYIDLLGGISPDEIVINRRWQVSHTNGYGWSYIQRILIDISGFSSLVTVNDPSGSAIANVVVNGSAMTNDKGQAIVTDTPTDLEYIDADDRALTIRDIVLLSRQLDGQVILTDPIALAAADLDGDNRLTLGDRSELVDLVLGTTARKSYGFIDYHNMSTVVIDPLGSFIGYKLGDVDFSGLEGEEVDNGPSLSMKDLLLNNGETYTIDLKITDRYAISGASLHIEYDTDLIDIMGISSVSGMVEYDTDQGVTKAILVQLTTTNLESGDAVVQLLIHAKANSLLSLAISPTTESMLLNEDFRLANVAINVADQIILPTIDVDQTQSLKAYPNPVSDVLHLDVAHLTNYTIICFDIHGRVVKTTANADIDVSTLQDGIYLYQVVSDQGVYSGRFMVTR